MQDEPTKCYNMLHVWSISHANIYTEVVCRCEKFILLNKQCSFAVPLQSTLWVMENMLLKVCWSISHTPSTMWKKNIQNHAWISDHSFGAGQTQNMNVCIVLCFFLQNLHYTHTSAAKIMNTGVTKIPISFTWPWNVNS